MKQIQRKLDNIKEEIELDKKDLYKIDLLRILARYPMGMNRMSETLMEYRVR
ncbi:MAG: hypothetical protein RR486_03125 [Clostridium sp.]|uniref:hypothetical protein n=1 Tax=Clostridium sp. TaxID=1506 RepID=UPI00303F6258